MSRKIFLGLLFTFLVGLSLSSWAQDGMTVPAMAEEATMAAPPPAPQAEAMTVPVMVEEAMTVVPEPAKEEACACDKPVIEALTKAYNSLEEDEWTDAIKICNESIKTIETLSGTCKCPVIETYKGVVKAYLNYAQGGQILDGEEDIDCPKAKSLYDEAIKSLIAAQTTVKNEAIKSQVENIKEYCEEEKAFVQDECQ